MLARLLNNNHQMIVLTADCTLYRFCQLMEHKSIYFVVANPLYWKSIGVVVIRSSECCRRLYLYECVAQQLPKVHTSMCCSRYCVLILSRATHQWASNQWVIHDRNQLFIHIHNDRYTVPTSAATKSAAYTHGCIYIRIYCARLEASHDSSASKVQHVSALNSRFSRDCYAGINIIIPSPSGWRTAAVCSSCVVTVRLVAVICEACMKHYGTRVVITQAVCLILYKICGSCVCANQWLNIYTHTLYC